MSSAIVIAMNRKSSRLPVSNAAGFALVAVTTPTRSPRAISGTQSIDAIGVRSAGRTTNLGSCMTS